VGKLNRNRKPWGSTQRRKQIERLMDDTEIYNAQELEERKRRVAVAIRMRDADLKRQEDELRLRGVCTHCFSVLTTLGVCMRNCR